MPTYYSITDPLQLEMDVWLVMSDYYLAQCKTFNNTLIISVPTWMDDPGQTEECYTNLYR